MLDEKLHFARKDVLKNVQSDTTTGSHMGVTLYNAG